MARGDFPFNRLELNLQPIVARPRVRAEVGVPLNDRRPGGPTCRSERQSTTPPQPRPRAGGCYRARGQCAGHPCGDVVARVGRPDGNGHRIRDCPDRRDGRAVSRSSYASSSPRRPSLMTSVRSWSSLRSTLARSIREGRPTALCYRGGQLRCAIMLPENRSVTDRKN
jgi:hypothetical protein